MASNPPWRLFSERLGQNIDDFGMNGEYQKELASTAGSVLALSRFGNGDEVFQVLEELNKQPESPLSGPLRQAQA